MKVLLCGSGGFIGRHLATQLRANGHTVKEGRSLEVDYTRDLDVGTWLPRIEGMDAVINAVGVLRDSRRRPMTAIHHLAPDALFRACAQRQLQCVIHISALGIDGNPTLYAQSKLRAEESLYRLSNQGRVRATIVRPSIVFGRGGASSRLFMRLARLPLVILPDAALRAKVQPVAVGDLARVCAALLETDGPLRLDGVGPRRFALAEFIASLRAQLGFRAAKVLAMSERLSRASARCGDHFPFQPWCSETLALLQQDNVGDDRDFANLLGQSPTDPDDLVANSWND